MRRIAAVLLAAPLAAVLLGAPAPAAAAAPAPDRLTVVVLVVDGLRPGEVTQQLTPNIAALRAQGTWYEHARAVLVAETIPNHVAMMTGTYPSRNGIPANSYWNRTGAPASSDLSGPAEVASPTLFTTIHAACPTFSTASVLAKRYLWEIFRTGGINRAADFHWRPDPLIANDSAPANAAMTAALAELPRREFLFVNLGDVDRIGHFDFTGPGPLPATRTAALATTDREVGRLVTALKESGRWGRTVVFLTSDHGFDWSLPPNYVNLGPSLPPNVHPVQNGGAASYYLKDPADPAAAAQLKQVRQAALAHPGVDRAWYRVPNPLDPDPASLMPPGLAHRNGGDLVVLAKTGYRTSEPSSSSNPIPGNHGHLVTRHNTFLVTGGASFVRAARSVGETVVPDPLTAAPGQAENVDVAPTVAWLLGIGDDEDLERNYDGRVLGEAFSTDERPSQCGRLRPALVPVSQGAEAGDNRGQTGSERNRGSGLAATGATSGGALPLSALAAVLALAVAARRRTRPATAARDPRGHVPPVP